MRQGHRSMVWRIGCFLVIAVLGFAAFGQTSARHEHRIRVRQVDGRGEFFDRETGARFVPRGANYVFVPAADGGFTTTLLRVGTYDAQRTRADFARLSALGYNTVRVFLDHCSLGPGCITTAGRNGLEPAYLDHLADMMEAAWETELLILFTSNDLPDGGGYADEANRGSGDDFAGYRNSYYLTPNAISATRRYWADLLSGLKERGAPFATVLGWQLVNEQWMFVDQPPLSLTEGTVETTTGRYDMSDDRQKAQMVDDGLVYYIEQMREEILLHDPSALVTMGFFVPELVAPDWYVSTEPLLRRSELDFFDFHAYPGSISLEAHAEAFGMIGFESKPILLGEYGPFRHRYPEIDAAARAVSEWVAASCDVGFDGWLYWSYYPDNVLVGDRTWGLVDEQGDLLELFAPANHPDPCIPVEVVSDNVALGANVVASRALPTEPAGFAVDGDMGTQWGAGASPVQWIEIDLGGPHRVREVRLRVAQWPAGRTIHQLQLRGSGTASGRLLHVFDGITQEGDWLVFTPQPPRERVTHVFVRTTESPSWVAWKEIEVLGEPQSE